MGHDVFEVQHNTAKVHGNYEFDQSYGIRQADRRWDRSILFWGAPAASILLEYRMLVCFCPFDRAPGEAHATGALLEGPMADAMAMRACDRVIEKLRSYTYSMWRTCRC